MASYETNGLTNKLYLNWSDSTFFPWLNPTTVLDYFCNTNNPFYNHNCNNEQIKMQNVNPEQLLMMTGLEYQLYLSQPPLYIIRKVDRKSPKEFTELSYYYVLNGIVYQAPDFLSVISSRLQTVASHLHDTLDNISANYRYYPSRGYYWTFNQTFKFGRYFKNYFYLKDETFLKDSKSKPSTQFQRERIDSLLNEFTTKFPPVKFIQPNTIPNNNQNIGDLQSQTTIKSDIELVNPTSDTQKSPIVNGPPEKKAKISRS